MDEAVVERPKQKSVTLSDRLIADYTIVARWKGIPLAKLLSQRLEADHESPEFAELLKRANAEAPSEEAAGND